MQSKVSIDNQMQAKTKQEVFYFIATFIKVLSVVVILQAILYPESHFSFTELTAIFLISVGISIGNEQDRLISRSARNRELKRKDERV